MDRYDSAFFIAWCFAAGLLFGFVATNDAYPHEATPRVMVQVPGGSVGSPPDPQKKGWSYPWACCSNQDCRRLETGEIEETPKGYLIVKTGEVISYGDKRVKDVPPGTGDNDYHWCAHQAGADAGHTICLFVPPKGF